MADAKQCDRCGSFFKRVVGDPEIGVVKRWTSTTNPGKIQTAVRDCCDECLAELKAWWDEDATVELTDEQTDEQVDDSTD